MFRCVHFVLTVIGFSNPMRPVVGAIGSEEN
jgi:hypothetical protein